MPTPRRVLAALCVASATVLANGRPPATSSIQFRAGAPTDVLIGVTFGTLLSHDGGATWQWMCESAVGYGGPYDPQYIWFNNGAIFATTTNGLHVSRDGCTFSATTLASDYISAIARGPDNSLYAAAADPNDAKIYKSDDEGLTFPQTSSPGAIGSYWQTIVAAPSDASRVYLSGWVMTAGQRTHLLFRSIDGGQSFAAMPTASFAPISSTSTIDVVAVAVTNPDAVFVRVTSENGTTGDALYRSTDGAQTFVKVFEPADAITGFVIRGNGDILVATPTLGISKSVDGGLTFQSLATTPSLHSHCLVESPAGSVWACTDNYANEMMGAAISTDGAAWTSALQYQAITQPIGCGSGTVQINTCEALLWCGLRAQLGITADPTNCPGIVDGAAPHRPSRGCCDSGGSGDGLVVGAIVAAIAVRRRRVQFGMQNL